MIDCELLRTAEVCRSCPRVVAFASNCSPVSIGCHLVVSGQKEYYVVGTGPGAYLRYADTRDAYGLGLLAVPETCERRELHRTMSALREL